MFKPFLGERIKKCVSIYCTLFYLFITFLFVNVVFIDHTPTMTVSLDSIFSLKLPRQSFKNRAEMNCYTYQQI